MTYMQGGIRKIKAKKLPKCPDCGYIINKGWCQRCREPKKPK